MTFSLPGDWLIYVYYLVEWYFNLRVDELKIKAYYDYCCQYEQDDQEVQVQQNDCLVAHNENQLTYQPIMPITTVSATQVSKPELNDMAEELLAELQNEIEEVEVTESTFMDDSELYIEPDFDFEFELDSDPDCSDEEDCILLTDLEEEEQPTSPIGYEQYASAKIADNFDGPQQWVVSIVGIEEDYIHVSDGKRLWINIGQRATKINRGDVLILDVIRNGKEITVEKLFRIESNTTDDYCIPDESINYHDGEQSIAI